MTGLEQSPPVVGYEPSLGRATRRGDWSELARGTFGSASERVSRQDWDSAAQLIEVALLEAEELHEIYDRWPASTVAWIGERGVPPDALEEAMRGLSALIGETAMGGIAAEWPTFVAAVDTAADACRSRQPLAADRIEAARRVWQGIHDRAVDRVSGIIDIAVKLVGEHALGELWDFLMSDWYDVHARRYALDNQRWSDSAHQLMIAIVDGFHAHLTGAGRQGDITVIEETDRIGFRFAPCGSGGRSVDATITEGSPRAGAPYGFAVTTERHDWAWNTIGICSYCVHCCQLNEVMPIDRLGYPTRVIDAPVWSPSRPATTCTWWVYRDPADVPDHVYHRVGRDPSRRPSRHRSTPDV